MAMAMGVLMANRNNNEKMRISVVTATSLQHSYQKRQCVEHEKHTAYRNNAHNEPFGQIHSRGDLHPDKIGKLSAEHDHHDKQTHGHTVDHGIGGFTKPRRHPGV